MHSVNPAWADFFFFFLNQPAKFEEIISIHKMVIFYDFDSGTFL